MKGRAEMLIPFVDESLQRINHLVSKTVRGVAFLFSITGYPHWGRVFYTTNEAMNAAQLSALSVIVLPPPSQPMSPPPPLPNEPSEPSRGYLYIQQELWRDRKDDA
ncbi:hypothetical protein RHMOL_Rhmol08G0116800 [Rhododendron molle]|uniref:Uncharacterized protein n=1 Tax=Rhododendron molle TaxID=49168 RepID=A0ACC0MNL8_RHOML|nr:hypothetical protein RHMOL_Rhmol08G0116800 [Rhododendron molle]